MNQLVTFRYIQTDQPCLARDTRKKHEIEIAQKHCYFIGFRITVDHVMNYRHSLVLADDYQSLLMGIDEERKGLDKRLAVSRNDIELVFLRNMGMRETAMLDSIGKYGITAEIQKTLSRRDDHHFTVFGKLENEQICLFHETAQDALTAMRLARLHSGKFAARNFQPLDVRQAHPATYEFDFLFERIADGFMKLVGNSGQPGCVH